MNMNDYDAKRYAMFQFGMNSSATKFIFHFRPNYCGYVTYVFNKKDNPDTFSEAVVDFLARISLTHTIIDIDEHVNNDRTHSEFVVWTKQSFDTNIDADVIDGILKNIMGK